MSVKQRSRVAEQLATRAKIKHAQHQLEWVSFQAVTIAIVGAVAAMMIAPIALALLWFSGYGIAHLVAG